MVEAIQPVVEFATQNAEWIGLVLLIGALSTKQRLAIRGGRDDEKCQAPFRHKCNGWGFDKDLNVHHIIPQRWSREHLGQSEDQYDVPENVLTVCTHAHDMIHPDNADLRRGFATGTSQEVLANRDRLANQGMPYWYPGWDQKMLDKAKYLTKRAIEKGWRFPGRNGKNHE